MDITTKNLLQEIQELKTRLKAVILAHNYQPDDIQANADITGDSLELARAASKTTADVIVFCGVHFMAETAAILNPEKTVLMPNPNAGCPMADMINAQQLRQMKAEHPNAAVVCYVNSSAEVKAESDICCTSSNAIQVVNSVKEDEIIFVPDKNLGRYVSSFTNKNIICWKGFCPTHVWLTVQDVIAVKQAYPEASFIAHPECEPEILAMADYVCSTAKMLKYAKEATTSEIIVGTEVGMLFRLSKENPQKTFIPASSRIVCPNMKKNSLETLHDSLLFLKTQIEVPRKIRERALGSIKRMLDVI
ncbi:MAG: quinolinate synthase NadA [bacterium]